MATPMKSMYAMQNSCKPIISRQFHCVSHLAGKQIPRRSPRVAASLRQGPSTRVQKTYDPKECLPPIVLLQAGSKSGALPISPHTSVQILLRYQELAAEKQTPGWEGELCAEFSIKPKTLFLLAGILNRCSGNGQKRLAHQLINSASKLGERAATFRLIESAIRSGSLDHLNFVQTLQRLGILAKKDGDRQAMTLLGKVLLSQQQEREALEWFRKASQGPAESLNFEGAGEALVNEGRILLSRKDNTGAAAAFRKAALELDDPSGYYYLSQLEKPNSSEQQVYLLKAASSGIVEAWHNLGAIELARIERQSEKQRSIHNYGMAREWFQVAAAEGFGLSMLNLASICKAAGDLESGLKWLEKAEEKPEVQDLAKSLRLQWETDKAKLS